MKKVWRFVRVFFGAVCITFVITFAVLTVSERKLELLIGAALFAVLSYFLLRSKKMKAVHTPRSAPRPAPAGAQSSSRAPDAPEETLQKMRRYYTAVQAQEDAHIMQESLQLIQQTTNFDTFLSRLGMVQRSALTLLQAERAGWRGIQPGTREACEKALEAARSANEIPKIVAGNHGSYGEYG